MKVILQYKDDGANGAGAPEISWDVDRLLIFDSYKRAHEYEQFLTSGKLTDRLNPRIVNGWMKKGIHNDITDMSTWVPK